MHILNDNDWRIDEDGFLRITCCILKTDVLEYLKSEVPAEAYGNDTIDDTVLYEFVDVKSIQPEILATLEGKPVLVGDHEWQTVDNVNQIGAIAGIAHVDGEALIADVLITDTDVIEKIKNHELIEISAGYDAELLQRTGVYKDHPYDVVQQPTCFNHILLLPSGMGRCGKDVKIINTRSGNGVSHMTKIIKIKNGKTFQFTNEEDVKVAEEMVEEVQSFNAEEVKSSLEELETVKAQLAELQAKKEELEAALQQAQNQLEEALSPEHQAELAEQAKQQNEDEDAVIEAEVNEAEQETAKAECANCKTYADRRSMLVKRVLNSKGVDCSAFNEQAFDGAFEALVATSKAKLAMNKQIMGGVKTENSLPITNNLDRILRPMSK